MLRHLRNRWPAAHLTLCVRSYGLDLFANCPDVDELRPYEPLRWAGKFNWPRWLSSNSFVGRILQGLCFLAFPSQSYDLAILPLYAPWSNHHRVMQLIPARYRVGISGNIDNQKPGDEQLYRRIYSGQLDVSALPWDFPVMDLSRLFLGYLGMEVTTEDLWPQFWTTAEDHQKAKALIAPSPSRTVLGIAPGVASVPGKNLPAHWYAQVIAGMGSSPLQIVLLGSLADRDVCQGVAQALEPLGNVDRVVNLAGMTSVREMVECVRCCDVILSQETAALHIATALCKPVVGIVGGGHYGRFYPWGDPETSRVVNQRMDCYGCNWRCKYDSIRCIQEIPATDATKELLHLLRGLSHPSVREPRDRRIQSPDPHHPPAIHGN
jgi:ADP-heptose:LPS heptosyltransferase